MEQSPDSVEKNTSYQNAALAQGKFHEVADRWYRRLMPFPRMSSALGTSEEGVWELVIMVEKESHVKRVLGFVNKHIRDVPVRVEATGIIRAH